MRARLVLLFLTLAALPNLACGQLLQIDGTKIVNSSTDQEVILTRAGRPVERQGQLAHPSVLFPASAGIG